MQFVRYGRWGAVLICVWWWALVSFAQTPTPPSFGASLETNLVTNGRIDDRNPRQVYFFDGSRGEVVRFALTVTTGTLDPVLTVFDASGAVVFTRDDQLTPTDISITASLPNDSRYYVVVARFGYGVGSTAGEFKLTLERVGVVSQQGTTLIYGVPVLDTITNTQPQVYYTLRANAGDILNIEMKRSSGTLDPYLQLVDANRFVLTSNDDAPEGGRNARIENYLIEQTGVYVVVATRYGQTAGDSVGSFVLSVSEGQGSGIGNSSRAPALIEYNQTLEGDLNTSNYERYYRFTARQDDLVTVAMEQIGGQIDAYLVLADSTLTPLIEDDDSGGGRNARINLFRIPTDGDYVLIAMRYGGATGEGEGRYRLTLQQRGSAFEGVDPTIPRLVYGTTVTDEITEADPDSVYVFWGYEGDIVTISMSGSTGNLDAVLEVYDAQERRLLRDDDSGGNKNALIDRYTLPYSGVYRIRAQRYQGDNGENNTQGQFLLVLALTGKATAP